MPDSPAVDRSCGARPWAAAGAAAVPLLALLLCACSRAPAPPGPDGAADSSRQDARAAMVEEQLAARGIEDERVLDAMRKVERHRFVPEPLAPLAYDDGPLPIGQGQTISQPYVVARMTELLELSGDERVLEIGTGSGYQAAILGELTREVYTIEIVPELGERSRNLLAELGYRNVQVRVGDGYRGWPEAAPFDAILLTAAPDHVPEPLVEQLAEGGRMVLPVGEGHQELRLLVKRRGEVESTTVLPVRFVPMTGEAQGR